MGSFSKLAVIVGFVNLSSALPQAGGSIAYSASGFSHGDGANYISADDHSVNKTEPFVPRSDGGPVSSSTDPTNPVPPGQLDADPDAAQTTSNATSSYTISNVVINRSKSDTDVSSPLIPLIEYFDLMISTNASTNDNSNAAPSAHCNLTWTPVMDVMPYMTCDDRVGVSPHFNAQLQQDTPSALAGFTLSVSTGPLGYDHHHHHHTFIYPHAPPLDAYHRH